MTPYNPKEPKMYIDASLIQDASNPAAILNSLQEMVIACRDHGTEYRTNIAVIATFYKVYDMLGAPSEEKMYNASVRCDMIQISGEVEK